MSINVIYKLLKMFILYFCWFIKSTYLITNIYNFMNKRIYLYTVIYINKKCISCLLKQTLTWVFIMWLKTILMATKLVFRSCESVLRKSMQNIHIAIFHECFRLKCHRKLEKIYFTSVVRKKSRIKAWFATSQVSK